MIDFAIEMAAKAHRNQTRKGTEIQTSFDLTL